MKENKHNLPWKREVKTSHITQAPIIIDCAGRQVCDIWKPTMEEATELADFIVGNISATMRIKEVLKDDTLSPLSKLIRIRDSVRNI